MKIPSWVKGGILALAIAITGTASGIVKNLGGGSGGTPANNSITNAMLSQMAARTVKCNSTASTANASDCTSPIIQQIDLWGTGATADTDRWEWFVNPSGNEGQIRLRTMSDAGSVGQNAIQVSRTGTAYGILQLGNTAATTGTMTIGTFDLSWLSTVPNTDTSIFFQNNSATNGAVSRFQQSVETGGTKRNSIYFTYGPTTTDVNASITTLTGITHTLYPAGPVGIWETDTAMPICIGTNAIARLCLDGTTGAMTLNGTVLAAPLSGTTGSIGGGALLAGACTSGTATVTGATTAMAISVTPVAYPGDGTDWKAYVSSSNTVTVKVCGLVAVTPSATTYNVRVLQ